MSLTLLRTSETSVKTFPSYQPNTHLRTPDGVEHSLDDFVVVKHHAIKEPTGTYSLKTPSANMKDKITTEQFNKLSSSYLRNLYKEDLVVRDEIELLTELKFPEEICEYCVNKPTVGRKAMTIHIWRLFSSRKYTTVKLLSSMQKLNKEIFMQTGAVNTPQFTQTP